MENSIEEAIERLEYIDRQYSCNNYYSIWDLECIALLLSDYKRVLKENEELENDNKYLREREAYLEKRREDIINLFQNQQTATTIPVQKIKDKIEELNKKEQELQNSISTEEREEYSDANISWNLMDIDIRRTVLQELLEGRK